MGARTCYSVGNSIQVLLFEAIDHQGIDNVIVSALVWTNCNCCPQTTKGLHKLGTACICLSDPLSKASERPLTDGDGLRISKHCTFAFALGGKDAVCRIALADDLQRR